AVEAEPVGLLGERVVGACGVEAWLEVLDQVKAAPGVGEVGDQVGGVPLGRDRDIGRGHRRQVGAGVAAAEGDQRVGDRGEGGGDGGADVGLVGCPGDHELVADTVVTGQFVSDSQGGVDAAV